MTQHLDFHPIPLRARHDGWTPARQHEFIMRLADTGSVHAAAERVGMSSQSAYRLRRHPDAVEFRDAWDKALEQAGAQLEQVALERVLHGEVTTIERSGRTETRTKPCSDRLLILMLERQERAARRRAWAARASFPDPVDFHAAELTAFAMTAEALPDRPGAEGEDLDLYDLQRRHDAPQLVTNPPGLQIHPAPLFLAGPEGDGPALERGA